tara:strand:- start:1400 stop:1825 length:426 start_codon:yes stop_codon:yes gene_type:complete
MPNSKCLNDASKTFTGEEPSPKGRGFCAHAERVSTVMKGTDNSMWKVQLIKNKTKRWIRVKSITKKKKKETKRTIKIQLKHELKGSTDKYIKLNKELATKMIDLKNTLNQLEKDKKSLKKNYEKKKKYYAERIKREKSNEK